MNIAAIKTYDIANGPGVRVSVFVSGCTRGCKGCFQPQTWDFSYGEAFTDDTLRFLLSELANPHIAGLTLLGGEPFEPRNQAEVARLLRLVREQFPKKSIWAFTGYVYEELLAGRVGNPALVRQMLSCLDVLVDGPFEIEKKDLSLRFRGSSNQRLIDLQKSRENHAVTLWDDGYQRGGMSCRASL
ncbi:MAG: anaerobic ribonucleoside-triphosphate reductase activating protein [Oscillospiraceae bacterium]|jgi:anaerobic ribonucleoside-triphosphate reductase activating protein|nr:anaerobic ribonucleoside-triphosphate reductase activating protein [Oscillospiraceae bacterium]